MESLIGFTLKSEQQQPKLQEFLFMPYKTHTVRSLLSLEQIIKHVKNIYNFAFIVLLLQLRSFLLQHIIFHKQKQIICRSHQIPFQRNAILPSSDNKYRMFHVKLNPNYFTYTLHTQNNETNGNNEFLHPYPIVQLMDCFKSVQL
jgi:hypothetical protein